jgi:hypothetical protein
MRPRPWDDIESHYADLNRHGWKHERFIELIRHIKNSKFSERVFATTRLDDLLISVYEDIELQKETLHISFDRNKSEWHFDYYAVPFKAPEFSRIYSEDKGIEKLDSFIEMIGW